MENTKENLEMQRYDINDILGAVMCMDDQEAKALFTYKYPPNILMKIFNNRDDFEKAIQDIEAYIKYYELTLRAFRELADILQVPKSLEG